MQNTENIISSAPTGAAIFGLTHRPEPRADFLVREESSVIKKLTTTKISLRARLFNKNNVALILIMFQIGNNPPRLFETFWNYYMESEYGKMIFELMSTQDDIAVHLYGESGTIEQSILMNNSFRNFFKAAIKKIQDMPQWSVEQFDKEKEELHRIYPSIETLWEAIK